MKFYEGGLIDKQGRVCVNAYIGPDTRVTIWVEDPCYDMVHMKRYLETDKDVPEFAIRKTDAKGCVIIPRALRANAKRFLISDETKSGHGIILKLFDDALEDEDEAKEEEAESESESEEDDTREK